MGPGPGGPMQHGPGGTPAPRGMTPGPMMGGPRMVDPNMLLHSSPQHTELVEEARSILDTSDKDFRVKATRKYIFKTSTGGPNLTIN